MPNTKLIDRFLEGELSAAEILKFNNRLKSDPEFKKEVDVQCTIIAVISDKKLINFHAKMKNIIKMNKSKIK